MSADFSIKSVPEYVTHTKCNGIVEVASIPDDVAVYVYCPTCQDIIEEGELSHDGPCYLVAAPEAAPEVAATPAAPSGSQP